MFKRVVVLVLGLLLWLVSPVAADQHVDVQLNQAVADFGNEVVFKLQASADQEIVDVALLYAMGENVGDVPFFVEAKPEYQPGTQVNAEFTRDTVIEYLPVGITVRYKWELKLADGSRFLTDEQQISYDDTRFNWQQLTDRGITVMWYDGDQAWGQFMLDNAVGGLNRLEEQIGSSVDDPMKIMVYGSNSDMRGALPPNSAEWIGGQARPDLGLVIGSIAEGDDNEVKRLIPHELSHLVLYQATKNNYGGTPGWFEEGLAVFNQDVPDFGFDDRVEDAARNGELLTLQSLASNFPDDPEKALLSYAQSASVIRYVEQTYGVTAIAGLVEQFRIGVTDDMAVKNVLNMSIDDLDAEWRTTLPDQERTADLAANEETAPASRFTSKPISPPSSGGSRQPTSASSGAFADMPLWIWICAVAGIVLILGGLVAVFRQQMR